MVERDDGSETSSALPKLLLELVSQVDENDTRNECPQEDLNLEVIKDEESSVDKHNKSEYNIGTSNN